MALRNGEPALEAPGKLHCGDVRVGPELEEVEKLVHAARQLGIAQEMITPEDPQVVGRREVLDQDVLLQGHAETSSHGSRALDVEERSRDTSGDNRLGSFPNQAAARVRVPQAHEVRQGDTPRRAMVTSWADPSRLSLESVAGGVSFPRGGRSHAGHCLP